MPTLTTAHFGQLDYADETVFQFPEGLPGFEDEHEFVFIRRPHLEPLIFMQSLNTPALCFLMLPIFVVCPDYRLFMAPEDMARLNLGSEPVIGEDVLCGSLVTVREDATSTVNLLAPIVVNLKQRIGVQAIQTEGGYSHQQPLFAEEALMSC
jgi:flagellar assembly factor FliW